MKHCIHTIKYDIERLWFIKDVSRLERYDRLILLALCEGRTNEEILSDYPQIKPKRPQQIRNGSNYKGSVIYGIEHGWSRQRWFREIGK